MKITVKIIGLGRIGSSLDEVQYLRFRRSHLGAILNSFCYEITGIWDFDNNRLLSAVKHWGLTNYCNNLNDFLSKPASVVVIATPPNDRVNLVKSIISHNKPELIIFEKPLATSMNDLNAINKICFDANVKYYLNYPRNRSSIVEFVRETINPRENFKCQIKYTKGIKNNWSHCFSFLCEVFGVISPANIQVASQASRFINHLPDADVDFSFSWNENFFQCVSLDYEKYELFELDLLSGDSRVLLYDNFSKCKAYQISDNLNNVGYRQLSETRSFFTDYFYLQEKLYQETVLEILSDKKYWRKNESIFQVERIMLEILDRIMPNVSAS